MDREQMGCMILCGNFHLTAYWDMGYIYRPQAKLWEGNIFTPVCQSFCSLGGGRGWQKGMHGGVCVLEEGGMCGRGMYGACYAWHGGHACRRYGY